MTDEDYKGVIEDKDDIVQYDNDMIPNHEVKSYHDIVEVDEEYEEDQDTDSNMDYFEETESDEIWDPANNSNNSENSSNEISDSVNTDSETDSPIIIPNQIKKRSITQEPPESKKLTLFDMAKNPHWDLRKDATINNLETNIDDKKNFNMFD